VKQAPGYEVIDVLVPNTAGELTVVAAESSIGRTTPSPARGKL